MSTEVKGFYSVRPLMSHNKFMNIIEGIRGVGKTTDIQLYILEQYVKKGITTLYLRFNQNDMRATRNSFIAGIYDIFDKSKAKRKEYKEVYKWWNATSEMRKIDDDTLMVNGEPVIYFKAVTVMTKTTSISFPENGKLIFYDEYLAPNRPHQYTINDYPLNSFMTCMSTFLRHKQDTRVILASNNITRDNPFMRKYNIDEAEIGKRQFIKRKNCVVESSTLKTNNDFVTSTRELPQVQFMEGTEYGKFAIEGDYILDDMHGVDKIKTRNKVPFLVFDNVVVCKIDNGLLYAQKVRGDYKVPFISTEDKPNFISIKRVPQIRELLNVYVLTDKMKYESIEVKNIIEIFRR